MYQTQSNTRPISALWRSGNIGVWDWYGVWNRFCHLLFSMHYAPQKKITDQFWLNFSEEVNKEWIFITPSVLIGYRFLVNTIRIDDIHNPYESSKKSKHVSHSLQRFIVKSKMKLYIKLNKNYQQSESYKWSRLCGFNVFIFFFN